MASVREDESKDSALLDTSHQSHHSVTPSVSHEDPPIPQRDDPIAVNGAPTQRPSMRIVVTSEHNTAEDQQQLASAREEIENEREQQHSVQHSATNPPDPSLPEPTPPPNDPVTDNPNDPNDQQNAPPPMTASNSDDDDHSLMTDIDTDIHDELELVLSGESIESLRVSVYTTFCLCFVDFVSL